MTLSWHKDDPVAVSDKIQIPSYTLTDYKYYSSVDEFTTGMIRSDKLFLIHFYSAG